MLLFFRRVTVVYYKSWVLAILLSHKLIQNSGISESSRNLQKVNCNIFCYDCSLYPFIRFFLLPIRDLLSYVYFLPANSLDKCLTFLFMICLSQQFFIIVHDTFNAMETLERVITRILKKSMIFLDLIFSKMTVISCRIQALHWTMNSFFSDWKFIRIGVGTRISTLSVLCTVFGKNYKSWFKGARWSWQILYYNNLLERKSWII